MRSDLQQRLNTMGRGVCFYVDEKAARKHWDELVQAPKIKILPIWIPPSVITKEASGSHVLKCRKVTEASVVSPKCLESAAVQFVSKRRRDVMLTLRCLARQRTRYWKLPYWELTWTCSCLMFFLFFLFNLSAWPRYVSTSAALGRILSLRESP